MRAYNEMYLYHAARNFGDMLDYAVNDCKIEGGHFLNIFIVSGFAAQFERGNPRVIAGMSGIELAMNAIEAVADKKLAAQPTSRFCRTPEYATWCWRATLPESSRMRQSGIRRSRIWLSAAASPGRI